jgi:hypothetical protein
MIMIKRRLKLLQRSLERHGKSLFLLTERVVYNIAIDP